MTDASPQSTEPMQSPEAIQPTPDLEGATSPAEPPPSYVKLAMRNMVKKGRKSLFHFGLTVSALMGLMVGLAYLTR